MDQGRVLDLDGVTDPETLRLLKHLDGLGIDVIAKLAATDFGLVNLYVVGSDRDGRSTVPIMQTACGEAADLDRERALAKALLEFCSSRSRKAMSHGPLDLVEQCGAPRLSRPLPRPPCRLRRGAARGRSDDRLGQPVRR